MASAVEIEDVEDVSRWPEMDDLLPHLLAANQGRSGRGIPPLFVANTLQTVGSYLVARGRLREGEDVIEECIRIAGRRGQGQWAEIRVAALSRQGDLRCALGRIDAGEVSYAKALKLARARFGETSPQYGSVLNARGLSRFEAGRYDDAAADHQQSLDAYLQSETQRPELVDTAQHNLGRALGRLGQLDEAEGMIETSLAREKGRGHPLSMNAVLGVKSRQRP